MSSQFYVVVNPSAVLHLFNHIVIIAFVIDRKTNVMKESVHQSSMQQVGLSKFKGREATLEQAHLKRPKNG